MTGKGGGANGELKKTTKKAAKRSKKEDAGLEARGSTAGGKRKEEQHSSIQLKSRPEPRKKLEGESKHQRIMTTAAKKGHRAVVLGVSKFNQMGREGPDHQRHSTRRKRK